MRKIAKISTVIVVLFFVFHIPVSFADILGESETFNVDSGYDSDGRTQVVATVKRVSERAYFYIENKWWNSLNSYEKSQAEKSLGSLAIEFDEVIYPELTEFFGDVWDPGIDNDSRITILMTELKENTGGYFNSCHEYTRSRCSRSNEREMIHVNANFIFDRKLKGFIAHELQHLINWNQKERIAVLKEDIWLNEMRSEYVSSLLDYDDPYSGSMLEMRVKNFLDDHRNPLGEWKGESGDYGVITLLGNYVANQFGENIFSLMSKNHLVGITSINKAFQEAGYSEDFDEIFANWSLANYYNSLAIGRGGKYGYTNPYLKRIHISPTLNRFYSYSVVNFSEEVKDWSPRWYLFQNKLSSQDESIALKIEFESSNQKTNFRVPYVIHYKDGSHEIGHFINLQNQTGAVYIFNFAKDVGSVLVVPTNHSKTANFTDSDLSTRFTLKASTVVVNQPVISSIFPSEGPLSGNNIVVIKGGNFQRGIEVYFGGVKSPNIVFINETTLNVVIPPHEAGFVNVWLRDPDGKSSVFAQGYEYSRGIITDGSLIRAKGDYKVYIVQNGYKRHILDGRIFDFYGHLNWANIIEVTPEKRDSYRNSAWFRAAGDAKVYEVNGDKTKHWLNMTAEEFYVSGRRWEGVFVINNQERDFYRTGADVLYR